MVQVSVPKLFVFVFSLQAWEAVRLEFLDGGSNSAVYREKLIYYFSQQLRCSPWSLCFKETKQTKRTWKIMSKWQKKNVKPGPQVFRKMVKMSLFYGAVAF